ncbi:capping protein, Arp2/3 and myosin-I linker protein 2 isoform X2 [Xenopus laevis]|uniref:Capping protein, Arp2/3 and myosin-I linker protein 2 isoform X2 n=1 Tax=Xenopus laevis TaxID=8355 RepID=A0A8J0UZZ8_XENLA|nr:capping protein, Arp2/3 and myosin-I linker protein 2 isoform X2 [Xenopus laevis]
MDLPTEGEKLQHYTRQRPRPKRSSCHPYRKPHVQTPEQEKTEVNEKEVSTKLDEGLDEFFNKKLIQDYHECPLQVSSEPSSLSSSGSRTFKKKIGDFFALRKPRNSKGHKPEKEQDGSPVTEKGRKPTLSDILRPANKSGETNKEKPEDAPSAELGSVVDPAWTPDASRKIKPRCSREGKSQSLILLSEDEEPFRIKQEKKRHCEKMDGEACHTFEHRVQSMLHRIGVTRVLSSEIKKKQNKDGDIKKAGSEGDIVDSSAESPPPSLKARTHSMSTAERSTPKSEMVRNPADQSMIWKDIGKQFKAELKGRCTLVHASPRRSLVILEHREIAVEKKSEDSWSLPGLERNSPAPSPSRIIHLENTSDVNEIVSEEIGSEEIMAKPRLRLKQFQNRRAISAHEEQFRDQGYMSELKNAGFYGGKLDDRSFQNDIETETSGEKKIVAPLTMKNEGNTPHTTVETTSSTEIDRGPEIPSNHQNIENV